MTNCLPDSLSLEVGLAWLVKAHPQSGGHCSQRPATVCPLRVPGPYCPIHSSAGYTGASLAPLLPSAHSFSALLIPTLYPHRWCAPHWLLPIHHPGLDPRTTSLESFSGATQYPTPVVLKVWSPEQQQQCHLTTCLQYKLLSPTTRPLLSQRHWERGLVVCLNLKSNRWFWYTLEFEKHYCVYVYVYMLCLHMYTALLPISHLKLLFNFLIDRPYLPKIQAPRKFMFTPICSMIRTVSDTQSVFNKYWLNKWIYKGINLVPFSPRSSKVLFCFVLLSSRKERGASQVTLLVKKNLPANSGDTKDLSPIPESGRSLGGGHGNPLQCSCPENLRSLAGYSPQGHKELAMTEVSWHRCMQRGENMCTGVYRRHSQKTIPRFNQTATNQPTLALQKAASLHAEHAWLT